MELAAAQFTEALNQFGGVLGCLLAGFIGQPIRRFKPPMNRCLAKASSRYCSAVRYNNSLRTLSS
jgi:hypothetical protein